MKRILSSLLLVAAMFAATSVRMEAQRLPAGLTDNISTLDGYYAFADTATATDSLVFLFYVPHNIQVEQLSVIAGAADTGAASNAGVFKLREYVTLSDVSGAAELTTATITAAKTLAYGNPSTTALKRIPAGRYIVLIYVPGTSDWVRYVSWVIHYRRY